MAAEKARIEGSLRKDFGAGYETQKAQAGLALNFIAKEAKVDPGKLADLVLLDGDPLTDITNTTKIRAVVANGRYVPASELRKLLADVEAAANAR